MAVAVKKGVYIVAGKRTPFGKYGGLLRDVLPEDLFATAAKGALKAGDVAADLVDTVNIGQICSMSPTELSSRHASLKAGIPANQPVLSMNKMSGSAFNAIICSAQEILLGAAQISLAGGMEVFSSVPFVVRDVRFGTQLGKTYEMEDYLRMGYFDSYCNMYLLQTADIVAAKFGVTRREADEFALKSQQKWKHADASGFFNEELVPVPVKLKNREVLMTRDEHPQPDITLETLSKLAPVFHGGITTPGNSTGVNDGAAAMILVNDQALKDHNLKPLARLVGWSCVGVDPMMMGTAAVPAVQTLLKTTGLTIADMDLVERAWNMQQAWFLSRLWRCGAPAGGPIPRDLIAASQLAAASPPALFALRDYSRLNYTLEIHETYAASMLVCARELAVNEDTLNVNGGAISIGHPAGASGARIMSHLTHELRRRGLKRGIASVIIAGGQGVAMIIETV